MRAEYFFFLGKEYLMTTITFASLGLPEKIDAALVRMNYTVPTSIQAQAIPFAMQGRDVLGSAQTGTGKTAAFTIPMIAKLMENPDSMALVLAPTRELAAQTLDVVHQLTSNNREIRTALLIGGEPMGKQFEQLRQNPRIIIGTPGRINDHLRRNPKMLSRVNFIAVDEADRMLDMGFVNDIREILSHTPDTRQTLCFSATMSDGVKAITRDFMNNPELVSVKVRETSDHVYQDVVHFTDDEHRKELLVDMLRKSDFEKVIVFGETKFGVQRLSDKLLRDGISSEAIHGNKSQGQRNRALTAFKSNRASVLVATDVAARGLDISDVSHVINYDLPQSYDDYVHRIGRTGRGGKGGTALTFVKQR